MQAARGCVRLRAAACMCVHACVYDMLVCDARLIASRRACGRYAFGRDGSPEKLFDRGCTDFALDFQRLGFESPVDVPAFELHHALDLPKELYVGLVHVVPHAGAVLGLT